MRLKLHLPSASASSSSTYEVWTLVGRLLPSNKMLRDALRLPRLKSATTTPLRDLIFGLREIPNSFKRTRSPNLISIDDI